MLHANAGINKTIRSWMFPTITMETEASHMLEAALEQMDDIIAGSKAAAVVEYSNSLYNLGSPLSTGPLQVVQLAEDLKLALEMEPSLEERENLRAQIPAETTRALLDWLQTPDVNLCSTANNESYQERLLRLEGDKETLVLQVSVLTDQVEAQGEKIRDLETSLEEYRQKLASTEEMLQQELISRTSLETQKLDLMDEVSYLKLKLVGMEETRADARPQDPVDTKQNKAECVVNLISELQEQMCRFQEEISTRIQEKKALEEREAQQGGGRSGGADLDAWMHNGGETEHDLEQEVMQLRGKVEELEGEKSQYERRLRATKTEMSELQQLLATKDAEIECLQTQLLARGSSANDNAERDHEYHRLKVGMESLLASNNEKDRRIEELTILISQYRKMRELAMFTQGSSEEELSGSLKLRAITHKAHSDIVRSEMSSRGSSPLLLSSSPYQRELDLSSSFHNSLDTSLMSPADTHYLNGLWHQRRLLSSSLEELQSGSMQKPLQIQPIESDSDVVGENLSLQLSKYQTLPGKLNKNKELRAQLNGTRPSDGEYLTPIQLSPVHNHESDYSLKRPEKLEECILSDQSPQSSGVDSGQQSPVSPENRKTHRGIKKLWGKIRRSQSGSPVQVQDQDMGEFKRGGYRATAGPRLARAANARELKIHFSKWNTDQVCDWMEDLGLGQYNMMARNWVTSGQTLISASSLDLEKEMALKNPLHRKKLQLAVKNLSSKQRERSAELDYVWVTRWLDDIGLPQYKDQFNEGRVDGQMLQYLTVNDLLFLKVTSQLHHLSIKCAIHVLHVNKFNPNCLKRRPGTESQFSASEVVQWSNHRVMEWLRSVDLAEYAPNLRGSGVHGGLVMLEPRFNSETLAMLLNIPPQKTLLRRHLATNFSSLVGAQAQQEKREYTEASGYLPLNITAKVKPKKLAFSNLTHLRRRRSDEPADYVCPIESPPGQTAPTGAQMRPLTGYCGLSPILDREGGYCREGAPDGSDVSP
ncbi:liprin-beta-2b isoform X12 [Synchiropus splendidus]|uniref:liprin-beta-2b isoform X12 n=1 Tax=Synchiropus splendidus TaxID=270530 RepID=UPI00237EDC41|nr:liprin-beta-2b isoform X12 [Synchiropus splendidus]